MTKRYAKASKGTKVAMLDELCSLTGWSRRHARRMLHRPPGPPPARRARTPVRIYGDEVVAVLRRVWALMGGPCGKRLGPVMSEFLDALERHGELKVKTETKNKLCKMSPATIDRMLAPERKRLQVKGRHGTKPGTLLRNQIPIRTFAEWDDARPGFCEIDLVSHDGGTAVGEFCQTLNLTDVCSGWTQMWAAPNKAQRHVHQALEHIASMLPVPIVGLDSDNGSEFINDHLFVWCGEKGITFTRSRAYRKNDNCFVEQKNWTHVRQQVGYARYDTPAELACLNELYGVLGLWVNFFSPQMKLLSKTRHGARVSRRYDTATTPYRRLLGSDLVSASVKRSLRGTYAGLNPAALSREIGRLQKKLLKLNSTKRSKEVNLSPPDHPWRRAGTNKRNAGMRTSMVRQRRVASRTS
ncbi:MAG: integrase catalytic domain-containing protein [Actinomycetota bacterium]